MGFSLAFISIGLLFAGVTVMAFSASRKGRRIGTILLVVGAIAMLTSMQLCSTGNV